jgi:hypothetical protein
MTSVNMPDCTGNIRTGAFRVGLPVSSMDVSPRLSAVVTAGSHTHKPSGLARHPLAIGIAGNSSEFSMVSQGQSPLNEHWLERVTTNVPAVHQPKVPTANRIVPVNR